MITFFNAQNRNKLVKEATKILLPDVPVNQKLYVPMLAKVLTMEESHSYDSLTNDRLQEILRHPEHINLSKKLRHYMYHTNPEHFV